MPMNCAGDLAAPPSPAMRARTLLTQVLAVNAVLVGLTAFVVAAVTRDRFEEAMGGSGLLLLVVAVLSAILLNSLLLRRRLEPIERLLRTMESVDLGNPGTRASVPKRTAREVKQLAAVLNRMLERIEEERRQGGLAVLRAQEQERSRIAQDLHDEVNQALTAILLRLSATMGHVPPALEGELEETRKLVNRAMDELLQLARQLRPTALDDHGLISALHAQVQDFSDRTGIHARFKRHGPVPRLSDEEQLVIYRVCQESLSNINKHSGARRVSVDLSFVGSTLLRVTDDGEGFNTATGNGRDPRGRPGGLGLSGMRERALLVGGTLTVWSQPGTGTTVELTMRSA
jgi:two-component system, NarL family, sensor histidine kinase UhpB